MFAVSVDSTCVPFSSSYDTTFLGVLLSHWLLISRVVSVISFGSRLRLSCIIINSSDFLDKSCSSLVGEILGACTSLDSSNCYGE